MGWAGRGKGEEGRGPARRRRSQWGSLAVAWVVVVGVVLAGLGSPAYGATPNDPLYPGQWESAKVWLAEAWEYGRGDPRVVIAVVDGGVVTTNRELAPQLVPGWDVLNRNAVTNDVAGNEHGSHMASIAAAAGNNGFGMCGAAPGCRIMPVQICQNARGSAYDSDGAAGIRWAADHGAKVIIVAWAWTGRSEVESAAAYAKTRGALTFCALGNRWERYAGADSPHIITISATGPDDEAAFGWGPAVDLAAPGKRMTYASWYDMVLPGAGSGTSEATAFAAGVAALVWSVNPGLSPEQVESILFTTADDLGPAGRDERYGWGRVNAARAVVVAAGGAPAHVHGWVLQGQTNTSELPMYSIYGCGCGAWRVEVMAMSVTAKAGTVLVAGRDAPEEVAPGTGLPQKAGETATNPAGEGRRQDAGGTKLTAAEAGAEVEGVLRRCGGLTWEQRVQMLERVRGLLGIGLEGRPGFVPDNRGGWTLVVQVAPVDQAQGQGR